MSIDTLGGALDVNSQEAALWSENMRLKSENEWLWTALSDAVEMAESAYDELTLIDRAGVRRLREKLRGHQQRTPGKETPEGTWVSDKEFWENPK